MAAQSLSEFYLPYIESEANKYWYLIPRAQYWNRDNLAEAHRVFEILAEYKTIRVGDLPKTNQLELFLHNPDEIIARTFTTEAEILERMIHEGIVAQWADNQTQADQLAKLRNYFNLFNRLGFGYINSQKNFYISEIGFTFLKANDEDEQISIIEQQLVKLQFWNPTLNPQDSNLQSYKKFRLFPYLFLIELLLYLPDGTLSSTEFSLFVSIVRNYDDIDLARERIERFRTLPYEEQQEILVEANITFPQKANARVTLGLFGLTPSVEFADEKLSLVDFNRAQMLVDGYRARLVYVDYATIEDWYAYFGTDQDDLQLTEVIKYYAEIGEEEKAQEVILATKDQDAAKSLSESLAQALYERHIEDFLETNLHLLEPNLTLVVDGRQYVTDVGRIDLLARDASERYVVIELKRDRVPDKTIGQILRYMGWIKQNLTAGEKVRGIIVGQHLSDKLIYACHGLQHPDPSLLTLKEIDVNLSLAIESREVQ